MIILVIKCIRTKSPLYFVRSLLFDEIVEVSLSASLYFVHDFANRKVIAKYFAKPEPIHDFYMNLSTARQWIAFSLIFLASLSKASSTCKTWFLFNLTTDSLQWFRSAIITVCNKNFCSLNWYFIEFKWQVVGW